MTHKRKGNETEGLKCSYDVTSVECLNFLNGHYSTCSVALATVKILDGHITLEEYYMYVLVQVKSYNLQYHSCITTTECPYI